MFPDILPVQSTRLVTLDVAYDNYASNPKIIDVDDGATIWKSGNATTQLLTPALAKLLVGAIVTDARMDLANPVPFIGGLGFVQGLSTGLGNLSVGMLGLSELIPISQGVTLLGGTNKIVFDNPYVDLLTVTGGFVGGSLNILALSNSPNPLNDKGYVLVIISTTFQPNDTAEVIGFDLIIPSFTAGVANAQSFDVRNLINAASGLPKMVLLSGISDTNEVVSLYAQGGGNALNLHNTALRGVSLNIDHTPSDFYNAAIMITSGGFDIVGSGLSWYVDNLGSVYAPYFQTLTAPLANSTGTVSIVAKDTNLLTPNAGWMPLKDNGGNVVYIPYWT